MSKMEEHFAEATQENEEIFKHLDPDNNGTCINDNALNNQSCNQILPDMVLLLEVWHVRS